MTLINYLIQPLQHSSRSSKKCIGAENATAYAHSHDVADFEDSPNNDSDSRLIGIKLLVHVDNTDEIC